jgi:hypothetical protein
MAGKIRSYAAVLIALALGGCAAHPDPIIDTKGVDPDRLAEDWEECEAYTEEILMAKGVGKGAALGEAAGLGAIYGGTRSGLEADREKQKVFKNCMRGRGYRVLN